MMIANKTFESIKIIFISMWEKDKTQLLMKIESCNCNNCYLKGIISKIADVYFWLTAADVGGWDALLSNLIVYMYVYHELNRRSPQHNALSWAALKYHFKELVVVNLPWLNVLRGNMQTCRFITTHLLTIYNLGKLSKIKTIKHLEFSICWFTHYFLCSKNAFQVKNKSV